MTPVRAPLAPLLVLGLLLTACGGGEDRAATTATTASTTTAAAPAPAVPAAVAREPLRRRVAALFLVGLGGADPGRARAVGGQGWGAVVVGRADASSPGALKPAAGDLAQGAKRARVPPPFLVADPRGLAPVPRTRAAAHAFGTALHDAGVGAVLGPSADVTAPDGPLERVSLGEDPARVARAVRRVTAGYAAAGVAPVPGQFPGAGAADRDPDQGQATVGTSLAEMRARDLRPFRALAHRVRAIQLTNATYAAYDGVSPADLLPEVARDLLRGTLRFRGAAVSPDLGATAQAMAAPVGDVAVEALQAGCDLLYVSGPPGDQRAAFRAVLASVRAGKVPPARLAEALGRAAAFERRG
jgi:beta-N-acetylhexosaminidase